ncbi:DUF1150 family protein [Devosia sp. FJ2-5-3]|jgi:hypothetical protein|uniref:DUF1150 family protein n=1 Tax=Devosia sp. FJ2-5-3 TaxID=2976680 RepID=UPI0023D7E58D|nr:DUF1150 family protein [Devosia sp. FJ2-5-3]WEJ58474.1 DUF1150 domain-containing protein [Devosia sp. FJ2-5-3]
MTMMDKRTSDSTAEHVHPLKLLTPAQFAALGGSAVAYVKPVSGHVLSSMISDAEFDAAEEYQLVMSADGTPLMVADTADAVTEWLGDKSLGLATLH